MSLPRALKPFVEFPALLRSNGFAVSPDQTIAFIEAVGLLGPRDMADVYRAATASFAPPHERRAEFDALFRFLFHGHSLASAEDALDPEDEMRIEEDRGGTMEPPEPDEENLSGEQAATVELLTARAFPPATRPRPCAASAARRRPPCRAASPIAAAPPNAAMPGTCAARCARRSSATAKC
jgi:uncharacterized protein